MPDAFDLFLIIFLCIINYRLIRQYQTTKIQDYLLLAGLFIFTLAHRILLLFTDIELDVGYDGSISERRFLFIIQFNLLSSMIGWYCVAVIAYRMRSQKVNKRFYVFNLFSIIILLSTLFLKVENIPAKASIFGVSIYSLYELERGAIFSINGTIIAGQTYFYLLIFLRAAASAGILYALILAKNELQYPRFTKVKLLWIISMASYFILQLTYLSQIFFNTKGEVFEIISGFSRLIATLSLFIITITMPEGLLLTKTQILRIYKIHDDLGFTSTGDDSKNEGKFIDYLDFLKIKRLEFEKDHNH